METGRKRWQRRAKGCGWLLIVFVMLPLALLATCRQRDAHPSDQQLLEEFRANRSAYSELLAMVREEPRVTRVANDFIWIDGFGSVTEGERGRYLSDARLKRYRALFGELNLESGVIRYADGSVGFLRSSQGMVTGGSSKGLLWAVAMRQPVLTDADLRTLDEACVPRRDGCQSIRPIAPQWYMILERH